MTAAGSNLSATAESWKPSRLSASAASFSPTCSMQQKAADLQAAQQRAVAAEPRTTIGSSACVIKAPPNAVTPPSPAAPVVEKPQKVEEKEKEKPKEKAAPPPISKQTKFTFSGTAKPFCPGVSPSPAPSQPQPPQPQQQSTSTPSTPSESSKSAKFNFSAGVKPFCPTPSPASTPKQKAAEPEDDAASAFPSNPSEVLEEPRSSVLAAGAAPFVPKGVPSAAPSPTAELAAKTALTLNPGAMEFRPSSLGRMNTASSVSSRQGHDSASSSRASSVAGTNDRDSPAKAFPSVGSTSPTKAPNGLWRRTRSYESVDGDTAAPTPEVPAVEAPIIEPPTPAPEVKVLKEGNHALRTPWTLWYRPVTNPSLTTTSDSWAGALKDVFTFHDVETFWSLFGKVKAPTALTKGATYYLFRSGVQPAWEDPVCERGGEWKVWLNTPRRADVDTIWVMLALHVWFIFFFFFFFLQAKTHKA